MSFKKSIKKISVVALLALTASPVCGQDLLARQAPVDHRMKSLDTLAVSHYRMIEDRENPAAELYEDFSNKYAHRATTLPEHFRIDLRHFCMPTPSRVVTSNFGYRASFGRQHKGMDIKVYIGDSIHAAFSGKVRIVRYDRGGYGKFIVIRHNNGLETVYAGNSQNLVKVGQRVRTGQRVAIVGGEGKNTYCMFSIMVNGGRINPATLMGIKTHKLYKQQVVFKKNGINVDLSVNKEGVHEEEKPLFGSDYNPFENSSVFKLNLEQISDEAWCYPLPGSHVISPYGGGRNHAGVDVKTCPNDKIHAAFDGVVTMSGPYFGYGNCIVIKHGWGLETLYSHQSRNLVSVGQYVKAGDVIGLTGRTGRATTEHLHFEIHFKGHRFNPAVIFNHSKKCLQCSTITFTQSGGISSKSNG